MARRQPVNVLTRPVFEPGLDVWPIELQIQTSGARSFVVARVELDHHIHPCGVVGEGAEAFEVVAQVQATPTQFEVRFELELAVRDAAAVRRFFFPRIVERG